MLVADLAPHDGSGYLPAQEAKISERKKASEPGLIAGGAYTPPRSSLGSDSDVTPKTIEGKGSSKQTGEQGLDSRRQERRVKRNMSLREKEMETRLRKIERDNAMLMTTLTGIAGSFGQLNSLLPRPREAASSGSNSSSNTVLVRDPQKIRPSRPHSVVEEIQKLEPVMRELQAGAGRISMEEASSPRSLVGREDDESPIS
jgi:hypothetical protein